MVMRLVIHRGEQVSILKITGACLLQYRKYNNMEGGRQTKACGEEELKVSVNCGLSCA